MAELRAVGKKDCEGNVTDEGAVSVADLKLSMTTPPRGESMVVRHAVLEGGQVGPVNFSHLRAGLDMILRR